MAASGTRPIRIDGNGTRGGYIETISAALIRKDEFGARAMPEGLYVESQLNGGRPSSWSLHLRGS